MLSFHGVPARTRALGDPYHCECQKTARLLGERLQLPPDRLLVTFQMLLNLVLLGLVFRLLTASARQGVARRRGQAELGESDVVDD